MENEAKGIEESGEKTNQSYVPIYVGVSIGILASLSYLAFFLPAVFSGNYLFDSLIPSRSSLVITPLCMILIGWFLGYLFRIRAILPFVAFILLLLSTVSLNTYVGLGVYNAASDDYDERVTLRFDYEHPKRDYINKSRVDLDDTANWRSNYTATILEDGYSLGVLGKTHFLSNGTQIVVSKLSGDPVKIYENYLKIFPSRPRLAKYKADYDLKDMEVPTIGQTYRVVLFSKTGESFRFRSYEQPNGLTASEQREKQQSLNFLVYSATTHSLLIPSLSHGFILSMLVFAAPLLSLIAVLIGPLVAYLCTRKLKGDSRIISFILLMLQSWMLSFLVLFFTVGSTISWT